MTGLTRLAWGHQAEALSSWSKNFELWPRVQPAEWTPKPQTIALGLHGVKSGQDQARYPPKQPILTKEVRGLGA